MTIITRSRTIATAVSAVALAAALSTLGSAAAPRFFNDDPVWVEHDTQNATSITPIEVDLTTDLAYNFIVGGEPRNAVRAQNVNSVDEVPDSS